MTNISLIKIPDNLSESEHRELAEKLIASNIDGIELSIAGSHWGPIWHPDKNHSLDFLRFYAGIRALSLLLPRVINLDVISSLADRLEHLSLGDFTGKTTSMGFLGDLRNLRSLSVMRQARGLENIVQLPKLTELSLTGYSIEKLPFLGELSDLKRLYIGFGTSRSLNNIEKLSGLEELDILWVKQLADITAISKLENLVKLRVRDARQITELPDLSKLKKLQNIRLMNLSQLEDISSLSESTVEELILTGPNQNVDMLEGIRGSSSRLKVYTHFYKKSVQLRAEEMLGTRFQSLDKMNFEISNKVRQHYFDFTTWKLVT